MVVDDKKKNKANVISFFIIVFVLFLLKGPVGLRLLIYFFKGFTENTGIEYFERFLPLKKSSNSKYSKS